MARIELDIPAMTERIVATINGADASAVADGATWYQTAQGIAERMGTVYGYPTAVCAAVISHLSPRVTFARNIESAHAFLATGGENVPGALSECVARARKAIVAHVANENPLDTFGPNAHKTRAFAAAIMGDVDAVVIDTWAVRIALGPDVELAECQAILKRKGAYDQISEAYLWAAAATGLLPCQAQAISWVAARGAAF